MLGDIPVSDEERLRDVLYRNGRRSGYITGPALYNRLGLTTQIPRTIMIATNRAAQTKDFGTIRIKMVPRRAPIGDSTVPLLPSQTTTRFWRASTSSARHWHRPRNTIDAESVWR